MANDSRIKSRILNDLCRYIPQIVIPALLAFISIPIYTRLFVPSAYGDFNLVRVSNSLLDRASSWVGCSLTRYYNDYFVEGRLSYALTNIVKINAIIGAVVAVPAYCILAIVDVTPRLKLLFEVGILLFILQLFYNTLSNILRMDRKITIHSMFILFSSVFTFCLSLILIILFQMQIESLLISQVAVILILLPFLWKVSIANIFEIRHRIDLKLLRKFCIYGIPLTISSMGIWILDLSDRYVIQAILGSHDVGVYSACYNVVWNSLFLVVNIFFMMEEPLAMKVFSADGKNALAAFIRCETRLFLLIMVPLTTLLCCYSKTVFTIMVSKTYFSGLVIVPYVAISVVLVGLAYKYHLCFIAMEKTQRLMWIVLSSGASNIIFNLLLVPRLGILGAAIATLLSYLIYLITVAASAKKVFAWDFPHLSLLKITASAVICVYGISLCIGTRSLHVQVAAMVLSFPCYAVMLWLVKEVDQEEFLSVITSLKWWSKKPSPISTTENEG